MEILKAGSSWAPYLNNPGVLIGFTLSVVFAAVLATLKIKKNASGLAVMTVFCFLLISLLIVIASLVTIGKNSPASMTATKTIQDQKKENTETRSQNTNNQIIYGSGNQVVNNMSK